MAVFSKKKKKGVNIVENNTNCGMVRESLLMILGLFLMLLYVKLMGEVVCE